MYRLLIIGPSAVLISIATCVIAFFSGFGQALDTWVFLGQGSTTSLDFYAILTMLFPMFLSIAGVLSFLFLFFGIRRAVTKRSKGFRKFLAIFLGFIAMLPFTLYGLGAGFLFIFMPNSIYGNASLSGYVIAMGVGLVGVGVGSFLNFLGSFKA